MFNYTNINEQIFSSIIKTVMQNLDKEIYVELFKSIVLGL